MSVFNGMRQQMVRMFVVACCAVMAGCSGGDNVEIGVPPLGSVEGTVTLDGKPLANAYVEFTTPAARGSSARTDANGVYSLMYDQQTKGAAVGEHTVRITSRTEAGTPEPIPAKYNEQSELKATVGEGENTLDFALKTK